MKQSSLATLTLRTPRREAMVDITAEIQRKVTESGMPEGVAVIQVMHTTAAVTINENADPDVVSDLLGHLQEMVPRHHHFRHTEGNSDAHIKSSLLGASLSVHVSQGRLVLGTWQGIYFCEFDGPRTRQVCVRVLG